MNPQARIHNKQKISSLIYWNKKPEKGLSAFRVFSEYSLCFVKRFFSYCPRFSRETAVSSSRCLYFSHRKPVLLIIQTVWLESFQSQKRSCLRSFQMPSLPGLTGGCCSSLQPVSSERAIGRKSSARGPALLHIPYKGVVLGAGWSQSLSLLRGQ